MANKDEIILDRDAAAKLLSQVFEQCETTPNQVPVEVLASYTEYRKERFAFQKTVTVLMLVLFLLLPLLFVSPQFSLELSPAAQIGRPSYNVSVGTSFPISSVTASVNGVRVPVYEIANHEFSVEPSENGEMEVTVTLQNKQYYTQSVIVDAVDFTAPVLTQDADEDGRLCLYVEDDGCGIDYENALAVLTDGTKVKPFSYDEAAGRIVFEFPDGSMNIFIPDYAGNALQLVLTLR